MIIRKTNRKRSGATTVEFAMVAILLFTMLFGILEYARFLFMYHLATNAARDGARFACVHTNGGTMGADAERGVPAEPAIITADDVKELVRTGMFNNARYGTGMVGMEGQIEGYTCDVYSVTNTQLTATPPDLDPSGKPAWNAAGFQDKIAVRVSGTYRPVVPNLIGLSSTIPFTVTVLMSSEAN